MAPHVIRLTTITLRHFDAGERAPSTTPEAVVSARFQIGHAICKNRVCKQAFNYAHKRYINSDGLVAVSPFEFVWGEAVQPQPQPEVRPYPKFSWHLQVLAQPNGSLCANAGISRHFERSPIQYALETD
jgi:hypothetical protein